jgi:hypothetical protein
MATPTRLRQLIGGVWKYATVDEDSGGGGGSQNVLMHSTSVSSAQLLALDGTPVELLPAPGGRFYYFLSAYLLHYRFVTTPYTGSNNDGPGFGVYDLGLGFGSAPLSNATLIQQVFGTSATAFQPVDLFAQTADAYIASPIQPGYGDWIASSIENAPVTLQFLNGAALADGDGALTARLWYSLIDGAA